MNPTLDYIRVRLSIILAPHLGAFVDTQGTRYAAVRVRGNLIPPNWSRKGLVVEILEKPEGDDKPVTGGRFQPYWWIVEVDQINPLKGIREVAEAIREEFTIVQEINTPQTRETFERSTFKIYIPDIKIREE